jgi:hypothetical protein
VTIVLLPLVAVGAVVAWAAGARPRQIFAGVAAAAVLLLVSSVALAIGLSSEESEDEERNLRVAPMRAVDERIDLTDHADGFAPARRAITGIAAGDVRLVEIVGLDDSARAAQCRETAPFAPVTSCGLGIPVQPDGTGRARFLFQFAGSEGGSALVLTSDDTSEPLARVSLSFGEGDTLGDPGLSVDPTRRLRTGTSVGVSLTGFAPGEVTVTWCTPPGPADPASCGAPAPEVRAVVGASGTAHAELPVYAGRVGSRGERCDRGRDCAVAIAGRSDIAVVEVTFAGSADARPHPAQVIAGLSVAAVLLALAFISLRRGRWSPPEGDPFEGIELGDPFADLPDDLDPDPDSDWDDQPATSRRENETVPAATSTTT